MEFDGKYWFEDCAMLKKTYIEFFESNKKYLFVYCNEIGEYLGKFFDELPPEDIFIKSFERGDSCGAIFERDFSKKFDNKNMKSMNEALILIDEAVYDYEREHENGII